MFAFRTLGLLVAQMNDYQFKLVKIKGAFTWHSHKDTDEVFICLEGQMTIEFRDGTVKMAAGDLFVVPKEKEHRPVAEDECSMLLVEPRGVVNTGDNLGEKMAPNDVRI
jgi:mannose-6-phosphate isomerase-like protein (cupin superfamily)